MANIFQDKNILVTGGTGSIGSEIVRKLLQREPRVVRVLSNDENGLFSLEKELQGSLKLRFLIGDVKDKHRLQSAIENIDFVFHAAALKHVPLCEYNPFEAVQTNVLGTENIIEAALDKEISYTDVILYEDIEWLEQSVYEFTTGMKGNYSFWDKYFEPALAITSVAVMVYLFFTQRT